MKRHKPDYVFLGLALGLLVLGTFTLFNASSVRSEIVHGDPLYFLKRHGVYLGLGLFGALFFYLVHHHLWKRLALLIMLFGFGLMLAVFIPGVGVTLQGAPRWIAIGSHTFQPVEIFKLCLIVYLASFFASREGKRMNSFSETLVPFGLIMAAIVVICYAQRSLGSLALLIGIGGIMYFMAGLDFKYVICLAVVLAGVVFLFIKFEPFRAERWQAFKNPQADPLGSGYHTLQILTTIGSGGFRGVGLGHSRQKISFLPESMSDSIFAIWAEETGFIGTSSLLIAFSLLFWRGMSIARHSRELCSKLLAGGIIAWLTLQSFFNIAANTNLIPLSGVPLPFFSYGGSALIAVMVGCGILLNISRYTVNRR